MSVEQAKAFIERMKTDEAFREKVMSIEDAAGRIACIRSEGYDCTEQEINEEAQVVGGVAAAGGGMYSIMIHSIPKRC
ncbi:MAG: Nif11-like leader peptide family natural product precursor [Chlorobiaceae bacterium]|nr:Nif11-like leader peptide family natural product precursor [Chlorobiaceae bacterium]